eukprot:CAMPEP_0115520608 /NCGR_PEP_ID=MMETSP0271-20121206/79081_1 /TAXON_ID=71861 /ORGANISM="Scrippsiella trochoidea, Strain CCMP3099" /LENGTH=46 /DNA_ID= /DNA_START= /DNA_END= /DNA_ORIENTATION=
MTRDVLLADCLALPGGASNFSQEVHFFTTSGSTARGDGPPPGHNAR